MLSSLWNDVHGLEGLARVIPYLFIVLGFAVAALGQYARVSLESRVKELREAAELRRKHTPPELEIALGPGEGSERYTVLIITKNDTSFQARWLVATTNSKVVSGVMLQAVEFHPLPNVQSWRYRVDIPTADVRDDFVELRLDWESLFSSDLGRPPHLRGQLTRVYRLVNGTLTP